MPEADVSMDHSAYDDDRDYYDDEENDSVVKRQQDDPFQDVNNINLLVKVFEFSNTNSLF